MRIAIALLAVGHLALLGGCGRTPEDEPEPMVEKAVEEKVEEALEGTQEFTVPPGSSISVATSEEGDVRIVITIPEGQPWAGTYTSNSPYLAAEAQAAMKTLGDPGVEVSIEVDDSGQIHSITHSVTKK